MLKQKKPRRASYEFLPKKEKNYVDLMKAEYLLKALEDGNGEAFNRYIGIIQDYKDIHGRISEDWQEILNLPLILFKAATKE